MRAVLWRLARPMFAATWALTSAITVVTVPTAQAATAYADGDRVDAYLGGRDWQDCVIVKHNVRQGDYEVRCSGKPDTSRVPDDADHVRPSSAATRAAGQQASAAAVTAARPRADINANLRPVTLAAGGTPLSGLYLQLKPMLGNAASGRMSFEHLHFWPDGRVCEFVPPSGTDPADHALMQRSKPRLCGRYVFTPRQLTIDVPDHPKAVDHAVSNWDGSNFVMDGTPTVKVQGYAARSSLSGDFAGVQFAQGVRQRWHFDADGRFTLAETPQGPGGGPARQLAGRYTLQGNTLDLGSERHTVYPLEAAKKGRLVIDGNDMDPL